MNIRKASLDDLEEIAHLAKQMWIGATVEELIEGFSECITNINGSIYIVCMNDVTIAFAQCGLRQDYVEGTKSSPVGYLEGIYVEEIYRKQGIAKVLLLACQNWAKEKGCTEFASDCELTNEESLNFHISMGFEEANRIICFTKKL